MQKRIVVSVFVLLWLVVFHQAFAQPASYHALNDAGPLNYAVKAFSTHDGLPTKSATCALKTRSGIMWVGTSNGLCRFDGYNFKVFVNQPGNAASLSNNWINALAEDQQGKLWVGTMDGLNRFDPEYETFKVYRNEEKRPFSLSNSKVWSVLVDHSNHVWVGTDDGFNLYRKNTDDFLTYKPDARNPYAMAGKSVNVIIEGRANDLWLGNWSSGINRFDMKTSRFTNFPQVQKAGAKSPNDVWGLTWGNDGTLWVATYWQGLFKFDPRTGQFISYGWPDPANRSVFGVTDCGQGRLLVGGTSGIYWFKPGQRQWTRLPGLNLYANGDIYNDQTGKFWLCTNTGLIKIDTTQYKFQFTPFPFDQREIKAMVVRKSMVWVGTNNGLFWFDLTNGKLTKFTQNDHNNSLISDDINQLYYDTKGRLWILTENGFDSYDETTGIFSHYSHHSKLGNLFNEDVFRDIIQTGPDEFCLATDAGLKILDLKNKRFRHYFNDPAAPASISNNHLYCLAKDRDGAIWIGTSGGGVNRYNPATGSFKRYMTNSERAGCITNNIINRIFQDSKGNMWFCTPDGLNKYIAKTDSFIAYSKDSGFASNDFTNMAEDEHGDLWLTTGTGLSRFNPALRQVRNFDEGDGVFVNDRISRGPDNLLFVAGSKGLLRFNPSAIKLNASISPIYLTDLQIFNRSVIPGEGHILSKAIDQVSKIEIPYSKSVFSIEFSLLNYTHTEKNQYAYFLSGFDKKWNYVSSQRKATYTNLNPGTYQFHVKGANNDGKWNTQARVITIVIMPPWYRTWWAYVIYFALIISLGSVLLYYHNRQTRLQYEVKIAHIESEKERELNEKKLSFFTNISHEFRTPLTLIINPVKELLYQNDQNVDTSSLNIVYRNARRLLGLVDQLLLFRKAGSDHDQIKVAKVNVADLCKEVFLCFTHQTRSKGIRYTYHTTAAQIPLFVDREKIEIVLFNLLSNAVKFTPDGGAITVSVEDRANDVLIEIADTGCGIPATIGDKLYDRFYQETERNNLLKGGFGIGLYLVKSFVERHKGTVEYTSKLNEGTTFSVQLYKGTAHLENVKWVEDTTTSSVMLKELIEDEVVANAKVEAASEQSGLEALTSDAKTILIVDDNEEIREYIKQIFKLDYNVTEAADGPSGLKAVEQIMPDIVISDVMMPVMSGIELCNLIKENPATSHIPVILLTASSSPEIKLKGIEGGADDYISKPFDKELLKARVVSILKSKNTLQQYFFNEVTLSPNNLNISSEYREFLDNCIRIVENNLQDPDFGIQSLASAIGMSKTNLNSRIKSISGLSSNNFIRFIRLRKAAELFIQTNNTIMETAYYVGINDAKYFREQFSKLFNMNPSQYIKKYRNAQLAQSATVKISRQHRKKQQP